MVQIIVADEGWVFVGSVSGCGACGCQLQNAHCIRVWGTSQGLGQLIDGPTEKTILDPMGTLNVKSVLFTMEVDQDAWLNVIK